MPNGKIDPSINYVAQLAVDSQSRWPVILAAQKDAHEVRLLLSQSLSKYISEDVDIVVFGSLARGEWTCKSDVDWTMLIDGQANSEHRVIAREVGRELLQLEFKGERLAAPGVEGIFGNMAFSHEIVHHIGGQADTNRNTTQRILLLLESAALRMPEDKSAGSFERILRQILNRYLVSDSNFHTKTDSKSRIPRFLLNDIVRYWRTMCVDFAYKDWEQAGKKWALRNIKLRMSRKLLFVGGLFTVFSCYENEDLRCNLSNEDVYRVKLQEYLLNFVHSTPLNIVAWTLDNIGLKAKCCDLVDKYEQFVASVDDPYVRQHLEDIGEDRVYEDSTFLKCRQTSHEFQAILKDVCFLSSTPLREFAVEYGVF